MNSTTLQLLAAPIALAIAAPALAAEKTSAPYPWLNSRITQSALKSGHVTANGVSYYVKKLTMPTPALAATVIPFLDKAEKK